MIYTGARVPEETTAWIETQLLNEEGVGFKPTTLTLLLYEYHRGTVIGTGRRDILADCDSDGNISYQLAPEDHAMIRARPEEGRVALLEWSWDGGTREGRREIHYTVENLRKVPATSPP